ncbi:type II toxin-antitoxin system VapC family toxin [Candidatus Peregrinibacteria bacterium]|nr:type II toxin-antitoxin system VapC family toxin [Candidatus Peregrinibacteria bacterium]
MYLLDSNILIYYLEGRKEVRDFVKMQKSSRASIPVISVTELLAKADLTKKQLTFLQSFLDNFSIVSFDMRAAQEAARFKRTYKLLFPDAVLAGTAHLLKLPLVTRDKHFAKIRELKIIDPFSI